MKILDASVMLSPHSGGVGVTMSGIISDATLGTLKLYREIAADPQKRAALVNDETCVQFLAYVLDGHNTTVAQISLETLQLLSEKREHRQHLAATFGVLEALQNTAEKTDQYSEEVRNLAAGVFTSLKFSRHSCPLREVQNDATPKTDRHRTCRNSQQKFFVRHLNSRAKIITLQVRGLQTQEHRKMLEEILVRVKGVISIVFDMKRQRCTIRARPELSCTVLGTAVAQTEVMTAEKVMKNDCVEEMLAPLDVSVSDQDKENLKLPEYLPEEDSPIRDKGTVVPPHGAHSGTTSWLSSAAKFLQNSFYW